MIEMLEGNTDTEAGATLRKEGRIMFDDSDGAARTTDDGLFKVP